MTLERKTEMRRISDDRLEQFGGRMPYNSLEKPGTQKPAWKPKRWTDTGPKRGVLEVVNERAGELCEFPACCLRWTDTHHRLNRKNGGRHGEASERINGPAWLLKACRAHHAWVTSPVGERREAAKRMGWLLLEHQDALRVPVLTRHHPEPVWLTPDGLWIPYEEACA